MGPCKSWGPRSKEKENQLDLEDQSQRDPASAKLAFDQNTYLV